MNPATRKIVLDSLDRLDGRLRRLEGADARLDAVDPGKRLALAAVWDGNIKPRLDRLQSDIRELVTPLALGCTLTAEPAPRTLDLGKVYDGIEQLEQLVRDAKANAERDDEEGGPSAAERVFAAQVGDGRPRKGFLRGLMRGHHAPNDSPKAATAAEVGAANRSYWADRNAAAARSAASDTANRNAFGDKGAAAHVRDRVRNINSAARKFWRGRPPQA